MPDRLTVPRPDWNTGNNVDAPINPRVAVAFLNYVLNTQRWRIPAELELRVRKLRQELFVLDDEGAAAALASATLPDGTPVVVPAVAAKPRAKRGMVGAAPAAPVEG